MGRYALVWVPNGFDPNGKGLHTDVFGRAGLELASVRYRELKSQCREVIWVFQKSELHFVGSERRLWETAWDESLQAGIERSDIRLAESEKLNGVGQVNALTDGVAIAAFFKNNPVYFIEIFNCPAEVSGYFVKTYKASGRFIAGYCDYRFTIVPTTTVRVNKKWLRIYQLLEVVTTIAALTKPTYLLLYWFRCWKDRGRSQGFVRTLEEV